MESHYKIAVTFSFLTFFQLLPTSASIFAAASKNCGEKCGNLSISYPFGIKDGCFRPGFNITCNQTTGTAYALGDVEIIDISLSQAEMRVYNAISYSCNQPKGGVNLSSSSYLKLGDSSSPYRISYTRNKFTAVGCQTLAYLKTVSVKAYATGCLSLCTRQSNPSNNNSRCSGVGCCQVEIPQGLTFYNISFDAGPLDKALWGYSPCSSAFVAEDGFYTFFQSDIKKYNLLQRFDGKAPVVLDWVLGKESCKEATLNKSGDYACVSSYSSCMDSKNGPGYTCSCNEGYEGNPYIHKGCTDVNECNNQTLRSMCYGDCHNLPGNYSCTCPDGKHGNPWIDVCKPKQKNYLTYVIIIIVGFSTVLFTAILYTTHEKVKQIRAKEKCFKQNGGLLLQSQINANQSVRFKIYSIKEITKATNNFNENTILGRGGQGIVYKGIIDNNRKVAIKKSIMIDAKRMKVFAKEMYVLSLINHKNVIQILGCCLEVEVPVLVYEYMPGGTLYQRIQSKDQNLSLSFRLKIAIETASALAYLHTDSYPSIIHGDIKSSNILLDEFDVAKVSDFGASVFPLKEVNDTGVPGTYGYLDPESLVTSQLTTKSDVFSFGVVLLELLTRMKAVHFEESGEKKNLSLRYREEGLESLLDDEIKHIMTKEQISELSELLTACLKTYGDERPKMTKVVAWLRKVGEYDQNLLPDVKVDPIIIPVTAQGSNHSTNVPEYFSSGDQAALIVDYRLTR